MKKESSKSTGMSYLVSEPEVRCTSQILWIHGLGEHGLRYRSVCDGFRDRGVRAVVPDLRGHGFSVPGTEALLPMIELYKEPSKTVLEKLPRLTARRLEELDRVRLEIFAGIGMRDHLDDLDRLLEELYSQGTFEKEVPFFVFGHSMGGLLATAWGYRLAGGSRRPRAILLSSPALRAQAPPRAPLRSLVLTLSRLSHHGPRFLRVPFLLAAWANPTQVMEWGREFISDLEVERRLYEEDPLNVWRIGLRYLASIQELMEDLQERRSYPFPVECFYSERDCVVDPTGTKRFLSRIRGDAPSVSIRGFRSDKPDGWIHELLRSSQAQEVAGAILAALETHSR